LDLLISSKGEEINKGLTPLFSVMYMPTALDNLFFIAEIRENDPEKLEKIRALLPLLRDEFCTDDRFVLEVTTTGFKLKKRFDKEKEYMEEWEKWVKFSHNLYRGLAKAIGEEVPESFDEVF